MGGKFDGLCVCGSGITGGDCCAPIIHGSKVAATAEQLMRSRYSAYVLADSEYLLRSWHVDTRPQSLLINASELIWTDLVVCLTRAGQPGDKKGEVEFIASYTQQGTSGQVHENSRFIFENEQWFYVDGDLKNDRKIGRNLLCSCGSGKKFKKCCARNIE